MRSTAAVASWVTTARPSRSLTSTPSTPSTARSAAPTWRTHEPQLIPWTSRTVSRWVLMPGRRESAARITRSALAVRVQLVDAHRAEAVGELRLRALRDVGLDLLPVAAVVADALA